MELQFPKNSCDCLRAAAREVKSEEQTQEIRLPDAMPDIGKVLGAWGQVLIRSKEWRGGSMSISGGVMVWVLYAPEGGGEPQCVDTWIPFQLRWDFGQDQKDGTMIVNCLLRSVDARSVSARKLMARAVVSVAGEALTPTRLDVYEPCALPEDVQLLRRSYPVRIPKEAGEKTFQLDEELTIPGSWGGVRGLVRYALQPELIDKKVMADKVVFRGAALVRGLCVCEDGQLRPCDFEVPFSQYADLEHEYDPYANACVVPAVTNLELEPQENGTLRLKAGLVGQYVIYDRPVMEVAADAYSPQRSVALQMQKLSLPAVLDERQELLHAEQTLEAEGSRVVDASFTMEHPSVRHGEAGMRLEIQGTFQLLYYDPEGNLQCGSERWEGTWDLPADKNSDLLATCVPSGKVQASIGAGAEISCDIRVDAVTAADTDIPMAAAAELGEPTQPDPGRPSLILRRAGTDGLWDVAKQCGSTVDAIMEANALTGEPEADHMLLIPVQ